MKKVLPILLLMLMLSAFCFAQNLIAKVPVNASMVLRYSGAGLSEKLPASKMDTYASLKKKLFEEMGIDPKTKLDDLGIDLQQDAYQYLTASDSTTSFVTLAYIKNSDKFNQFIQKKNKKNVAIESKSGFKFYPITSAVYIAWDGKLAALVVMDYSDYSYYQYSYESPTVDSSRMFADVGKTTPYSDSSVVLEEANTKVDTATAVADSVVMKMDTTMAVEQPVDSAAIFAQAAADSAAERKNRAAREKFDADKIIKDSMVCKNLIGNELLVIYDSTVSSITNSKSYIKLVDGNADISAWIGSLSIFNRFNGYRRYYSYSEYNPNNWLGFSQAVNIFFEPSRVRVEQRLTSTADSTLQLFKDVFKSQQNPAFVNYLHPSDLGYLSVSVNTEGLVNYYYPLLKSMFSGMSYMKDYEESIDAYVDMLQVFIDEKGIADMVPGNAIFVLHSLKQRQVKYISYDYDNANFNAKPTEKTKTEMSPDFSFVFETRNEKLFNKFAHLPVKLGKKNDFDYKQTGDFYTLTLGKGNMFDHLYFKVKDGRCIITTSLKDLNNPADQNAAINPAIKQAILNNNYSGMFNFNSLIKGLSGEVTDKKNKKMVNYLQDNVSDVTFESSLKDDIVKTTAIINVTGDHKNSLQYFFDVVDKLIDISGF